MVFEEVMLGILNVYKIFNEGEEVESACIGSCRGGDVTRNNVRFMLGDANRR